MEKQKRWQLFIILTVLVITLYSILPTIFWYAKPLREPIGQERADQVALEAIDRVNSLQDDSIAWIESFNRLLKIQASSITVDPASPRIILVTFDNDKAANTFRRMLPTAGGLIPFVPAQLKLSPTGAGNVVAVERNIGVELDPKHLQEMFTFSEKMSDSNEIAPFYRDLVYDRVLLIAEGLAGNSGQADQIAALVDHPNDPEFDDLALSVAKDIQSAALALGTESPIAKRYFASYTQIGRPNKEELVKQFIVRLETLKKKYEDEKQKATRDENQLKESGKLLDSQISQTISLKNQQIKSLEAALGILKKDTKTFAAGKQPLDEIALRSLLLKSEKGVSPSNPIQSINLSGYHPFIASLEIDWADDRVTLQLYPDIQDVRGKAETESAALARETINRLIFNSVARIARGSDESITPAGDDFAIQLNALTNSKSFLALHLGFLAKKESEQLLLSIDQNWHPEHKDFQRNQYPVRAYHDFLQESQTAKNLGLVVYAPAAYTDEPPQGFRRNSIYVIARGLDPIIQKYKDKPAADGGQTLVDDFKALQETLQQQGFIGYSAAAFGLSGDFAKDYIFELSNYYSDLLNATRENFVVKGNKRFAVLEFTDVEQRILTRNKIEDRQQEDLVKWWEAYHAAQVDLNPLSHYTVPKPTENPYWTNFKLSLAKYFRGDDRKILKWGLDLSGGKTVRIGLKDPNNRPVTQPEELKQAANELYSRVNKMGVSETTIRVENDTILLDFPGSQGFSASELIKASAMYFHIVNEKFSPGNAELAQIVNQFLQEVWNEAVVTNRKDIDSINEIAWRHLGGDPDSTEGAFPRSENARLLHDHGLILADPRTDKKSPIFNDRLSAIAIYRGDEISEWHGQTHPLMIVFNNFALEGSSLSNVQVGFDSREGNTLMFNVKSAYETKRLEVTGSPRQDFYNWTSQFSEENIAGTSKEPYAPHGWRMAVILNDRVINAPTLRAALSDSGRISGRFTQREINQLAADLKAGSLSFTPRILSEQNVSPELGQEERTRGIASALISLVLVIGAMIGVYHFGGLVASVAVIFNLLIMWGVLQSIGAALTMPGIAALVLTIACAVDANVLVFERIREEFAQSGRIATAIQSGYRKAFSAIFDSNITTILVALILMQFDSGPIKGFATVLIIGIVSSMFTSLFMTRYFFAGWVRNPENKSLSMARLIQNTNFNFLGQVKLAVGVSVIITVLGGYLLIAERNTIFGMDFTGGYSLTVELQEKQGTSYLVETKNALLAAGADAGEIQVRELSRPNQLRIQLGISMEEVGHPYHGLAQDMPNADTMYSYQKNPRIVWVVDALGTKGLQIQESDRANLDKNWSVMSGQLSDTMRDNAVIALVLALIGILVYITFRFEFKYGVAAVVALLHDIVITLGFAALFHKLGFPVQIDLQAIGAVMMIIGYSLNDTIIVFDRMREDVRLLRKLSLPEVINHALNVTLNRTIMTSGTTLLVLLSLVFFGGPSIFGFALIMSIGILIGTFSSLYIAPPVMLWVHNWEEAKRKNVHSAN